MSYQPLWTLKNTLENILEYVSRFWPLANVFWTNADIRVTPTWTVAISWSVTNQSQIGWYGAQNQIPALMNMEATLANIDNIYIS